MPKKQIRSNSSTRTHPSTSAKTIRTKQESDSLAITKLVRDAVRKEIDTHLSRKNSIEIYTQKLLSTDSKVTEFIQQAILETTRAYRLSVNSYVFSHITAFFVLIAGLTLIFIGNKNANLFLVAIIMIVGSIIWTIGLQNRSPVKNSRYMVNHLAKLNIIFAGYVRQIHQVDAVFEELAGRGKEITPQVAEQLLNNLQDAMTEAMNAISISSNELDN